ncbi:MAG: hypothetical protein OXC72_14005, partial [Roseovarius sp.]|nr:hypothetical protein [Roseovarius sp.]
LSWDRSPHLTCNAMESLTSMLSYLATAFLVKTRHPKTAVVCGVVIPVVLYAFFAHVAGVAVPQGNFVRLP